MEEIVKRIDASFDVSMYRYCGQGVSGLLLGSSRSNDFYGRLYDRLEHRVRTPIQQAVSTIRGFVEADVIAGVIQEYDD